jgi:cystathionine gamma-synthase
VGLRPETLAAQALHAIDRETGAVVPPIHLSTTYARDADYALIAGRDYLRDLGPTHAHAERVVAALEGGAAAMTFASGMAAITTCLRGALATGAHVIAPRRGYFALRSWLAHNAPRWQFAYDLVDTTRLDDVRAALRPTTRAIWIETPANPTWDVTDIAGVVELARGAASRPRVYVDSTCATPVHTLPLALGADVVVHSATKYLAGHSDVLAGVVITGADDEAWGELKLARREEGACLGAVEAWLLLRGLRTLFARVERQSATAARLAARLGALPGVAVLYPGLASHPQHATAARQMRGGFGGMLSILTGGGAERAIAVVKRLRVWVTATSLGGVESLIEHRVTAEGPTSPTPPDLLRLSVGLEHEDDLFDDLAEALA